MTALAPPAVRPLIVRRAGLTAVAAAAVTNGLLWTAGRLAGVDFVLRDPGSTAVHPLSLAEIVGFSVLPVLAGWGSLALLRRLSRHGDRIWIGLAAAVLLLSFVPIALEASTASTKAMLTVIHLVVAAALVPVLRRR
jgi:uncharacterized membrane protein